MEFTLNIQPPTVTAQEHKVRVIHGKPMFYDTPKLKAARSVFESLLRRYRPACPLEGPLALTVEWRFLTKSRAEGSYRTTRPDTDNLQKLLKDAMTEAGFWKDDAPVVKHTRNTSSLEDTVIRITEAEEDLNRKIDALAGKKASSTGWRMASTAWSW